MILFSRRFGSIVIGSVFLLLVPFAQVLAQAEVPPNRNPETGESPAQETIVAEGTDFPEIENEVGIAIEELCPSLVLRSNTGGNQKGSAERDLQERCSEVVNAHVNGADDDTISTSLRALTAEEAATQGTQVVELSALASLNIIQRLETLRTASSGTPTYAFNDDTGTLKLGHQFGGAAGDEDFGRWSVYVNAFLSTGDREETANESGFDFDRGAFTFGADRRVGDNKFFGISGTFANTDADLLNGGKVESDGFGVLLYGTGYTESNVWYEGTLGFGNNDYDQQRRIVYTLPDGAGGLTSVNQTAVSSTDGDALVASIGVGKDFNKGANNISLSGHLTYLDANIDGYQESINNTAPGFGMAIEVDKQEIESLRSVIGLQWSRAISGEGGVTVPFVRADWFHEFKNDPRNTLARFDNDPFTTGGFLLADGTQAPSTFQLTNEAPDEDYFRLSAGASRVWASGWQGFFTVDALVGLENIDAYGLSFGVRKEL